MSFDPRDYDGDTRESEDRERREQEQERAELQAREDAAQDAREEAFLKTETPFCEVECLRRLEHTAACRAVNEPVNAALAQWRRSQQLAWTAAIYETAPVNESEAA
jgi:hypothetical protein